MYALLFMDSHIPKSLGIKCMWFPNATALVLSRDAESTNPMPWEIFLALP